MKEQQREKRKERWYLFEVPCFPYLSKKRTNQKAGKLPNGSVFVINPCAYPSVDRVIIQN